MFIHQNLAIILLEYLRIPYCGIEDHLILTMPKQEVKTPAYDTLIAKALQISLLKAPHLELSHLGGDVPHQALTEELHSIWT